MDQSQEYTFSLEDHRPSTLINSGKSPLDVASESPEQEWAKLVELAERRKIQNRKAQRKYRGNLKKRMEELKRHGALLPCDPVLRKCPVPSSQRPDKFRRTISDPGTTAVSNNPFDVYLDDAQTMASPPQKLVPYDGIGDDSSISDLSNESTLLSSESYFTFGEPWLSTMTTGKTPQVETEKLQEPSSLFDTSDYFQTHNGIPIIGQAGDTIRTSDSERSQESRSWPQLSVAPDSSRDLACEHSGKGSSPQGRSPLHIAAMVGHETIVQLLLEQSMDVNAKDDHGWTPLHLAVVGGHYASVRLLLDHGADFTART